MAASSQPAPYCSGDFEGCPPEGTGGDRLLNRLKNRDLPPPDYEPLSVDALLANLPPDAIAMGRLDRSRWTDAALRQVAVWEARGAVVEGYLLMARQQGPESCNCKSQTRRDYHLWIGAQKSTDRSASVIAEISPRLLPSHPMWRLRILERLARDRARVRVSGWLMWDQEHPDQVGLTRGTQWEIHPIHRLEVYSGGRWRELED